MDKGSVENQPSETALGAATLRALAALDAREAVRGRDDLAERFLPEAYRGPLKDPAMREWVLKHRIAPGMYEFMMARTAFFDQVVEAALQENIPQIVFLGAGYDSRPYRFRDMIKDTRLFELDMEPTQERKKELLCQAGIPIPKQLRFVSINFKTDRMGDILHRAGFNGSQKTLFVWEGVTYYLSPQVVDATLRVITSISPPQSLICFDYASHSPDGLKDAGFKKIRDMMRTHYPGEPTQFGIKEGEIEAFLASRGYKLIEHLDAGAMEGSYLRLPDGSVAGKVPALFCLLLASVSDHRG